MIREILTLWDKDTINKLDSLNWDTICYDTETTSLRQDELEITGISLCDGEHNYYVPIPETTRKTIMNYFKEQFSKTKRLIAHNIVFDLRVIAKYDIKFSERTKYFDTMIAHHLINENDRHGLKHLTRTILQREVEDFDINLSHYCEKFYKYGLDDSYNTWLLYEQFRPILKKENLEYLFHKIEMPFQNVLLEMAIEGVNINVSLLKKQQLILKREIQNLEIELLEYLGVKYTKQLDFNNGMTIISNINFNSSKQLIDIFNKLHLEITEKTPSGNPSVGVKTLNKHKEHPFVEILNKYKIATKLYNGFVSEDGQIMSNLQKDGKVRPNIRDTGTKTGRMSMNSPNCLHEDTEVLVKDKGWVKGKDVIITDKIATYNQCDDRIEFQQPIKLYSGKSEFGWHIKNQHIDMICTDNHRHLLYNRKNGKELVTTGNNFKSDYKFLNAAKYEVENEVNPLFQRLIAAIQADGYIISGKAIEWSFTKKRKYNRLISLLNEGPLKGVYRDYTNNRVYRVYLPVSECMFSQISEYMSLDTKTFNPRILHRFGDTFFEELRYWDGLSTRKFGERYCSINKTNVDLVHALCSLRGYRSIKSPDGFRVSVVNRNYSLTTNAKISRVGSFNYWCATVNNDTLLVRRNNKVWITKNCQQLPKPKSYSPINVREVFTAPEGYKMFSCDYSGQEVAVMAQQSKDPTLVKSLNNGYDMHLAVANTFYNLEIPEECLSKKHQKYKEYKEKYGKMRSRAKTITFGLAYGKGAYGFSKDFNVSEEEAQVMVDNYFKGMSKLKEAIAIAHQEVEDKGLVTSMAGRKRHFFLTKDSEFYEIERAKRQSFNFLIQGFSADMIRAAAINVHRRKKQHPEWGLIAVMTVHDEFVYIVKEGYANEASTMVKEAFGDVGKKFVVPVTADVEIGDNYGNSK